MKNTFIFGLLLIRSISFSQIPQNYYDNATGTGFVLKSQLATIVSQGHVDQGYDALYTAYETTHTDNLNLSGFENDGSVLDFYSENPNGTDPYNYNHAERVCGNYNAEDICYNREHLMPQSAFNQQYPMRSDIHHVIPSDGYVNNRRASYPFGTVSNTNYDWKSQNNSKLGPNTYGNYSGIVFEPLDEFKGDIARAMLYLAVRYENDIANWDHPMLNGTSDQVFSNWFLELLLDWHNNVDPVDNRELIRNEAAYNFQGNANPFVDHPEFADMIWNPSLDNSSPTVPQNVTITNVSSNSMQVNWTASTDNIAVTAYEIFLNDIFQNETNATSFVASELEPLTQYCFKIKAKDAANNTSDFSSSICDTTLDSGGTDSCLDETFDNLGSSSSSYSNRSWTGDQGGEWTASDARTDQTLNGKAITIRDGWIESPPVNNGISDFYITTKRVFSGDSGTFDLIVNNINVGTIPYTDTAQNVTISDIDIEGAITVKINNNSNSGNRVVFDDIKWSCYEPLSFDISSNKTLIYPNPVKSGKIYFTGIKDGIIEIYSLDGSLIFKQFYSQKNKELDISHIEKGVYFIQLKKGNETDSLKLIIQ